MADKDCVFEIPANSNGGDLRGPGFGPTTGLLKKGTDSLVVKVRWAGNNPPAQLKGRFMFSQSPTASSTQVSASPFLNANGRQLCFQEETAAKAAGAPTEYIFTGFPVPAGAESGKYELTFVAEDGVTQWSEDPEFDVGG